MTILLATFLLDLVLAQELTGTYVRYEGAEYESAFIPCGSKEVWSIEGGPAFQALVENYNKAPKTQDREITITLRLVVTPVDKAKNPQSHYSATAMVESIVSIRPGVACEAAT